MWEHMPRCYRLGVIQKSDPILMRDGEWVELLILGGSGSPRGGWDAPGSPPVQWAETKHLRLATAEEVLTGEICENS